MFEYINNSALRCYLANILSAGLYGACYVVARAETIGKMCGVNRPNIKTSILLTVLTLGVYPGVMLSILAFDLGEKTGTNVGLSDLMFNVMSLITAFSSGGLLIAASILFWAHAFWQFILAEKILNSQKPAKDVAL